MNSGRAFPLAMPDRIGCPRARTDRSVSLGEIGLTAA